MSSDKTIADQINEHFDTNFSDEEVTIAIGVGASAIAAAALRDMYLEQSQKYIDNYASDPGFIDKSDIRERMSKQLLGRGNASVDELLTASFGEWPPKGLDIQLDNSQRVSLQRVGGDDVNRFSRFIDEYKATIYGDASIVDERVIRMNQTKLSTLPGPVGKSGLSSTLGHEAVHILQGDNGMRARQIFGYARQLGYTMYEDRTYIHNSDNALEGITDTHLKGSEYTKNFDYLKEGIEMQARVHEGITHGYQTWGQLPANKEQLLLAMQDLGMDVPSDVMRQFEGSPTLEANRAIFSGVDDYAHRAIDDLNIVANELDDVGKSKFWNNGMPEMYADLIEMYGDGPGRERFGLGQNTRFKALQELEHLKKNGGLIEATHAAYIDALNRGDPDVNRMVQPAGKPQSPEEVLDNIKANILGEHTQFGFDSQGNVANSIQLGGGKTLATEMSSDGRAAKIVIEDAAGIKQTIALSEQSTDELKSFFQSDTFAQRFPDEAARIQANLKDIPSTAGDIKVQSHASPDSGISGSFNQTSGTPKTNTPKQSMASTVMPKATDEVADIAKQAATSAEALKKMNALQEIAEAFKGVKTLKASMVAAKGVSKTAKATMVGTGVAVAMAGGVAYLISEAHGAQRDAAAKLYETEGLTKEAYDEYIKLNEQIELEMQAENIVSQGLAVIITTPALEYAAKERFDAFSAKHGLSPSAHDVLGMSLFDGKSLSAEFAAEAVDVIPEKLADTDPSLHHLWRMTQELSSAQKEYDSAAAPLMSNSYGVPRSSEEQARWAERKSAATDALNDAKLNHAIEFSRILDDSEAGDLLLSKMDQDVLMDMVEQTAEHHFVGQNPLIKKLVDAQQVYEGGSYSRNNLELRSVRRAALEGVKDELRNNPEILYGYIKNVFGDNSGIFSDPSNGLDQAKLTETQELVQQMPDFMQVRTLEVLAAEVNANGGADNVHPYLKDLAALYKDRDMKYTPSFRREDLNEDIDALRSEILKNPEIISEYVQTSCETQDFLDKYQTRKSDLDAYSGVSEAEFSQAFARIKKNALSEHHDGNIESEHPIIRRLSDVYLEREEGGFWEIIDNPDRDRRINELEEKLRDNPEIISRYMEQETGDNLISYNNPVDSPQYIEIANALERLCAGDTLEEGEQNRMKSILNDPDIDASVLSAVKMRYGNITDQFVRDDCGDCLEGVSVEDANTVVSHNLIH